MTLTYKPERVQDHFKSGSTHFYVTKDSQLRMYELQPGWSYSNNLAPITGWRRCPEAHTGLCVEGTLCVTNDNVETLIKTGDAFDIPPNHDARVIGDEICKLVTADCRQCAGKKAAQGYTQFSQSGCCDL